MNDRQEMVRTGFSGSIEGREPHQADRVFSALLQDNYIVTDMRRGLPDVGGALPGTWSRMGDDEVREAGMNPGLLHDATSGFDASFYRNAEGAVVLAFAGSDEGQDWKTNFGQGLGFDDPQYERAAMVAREARRVFGDQVVFTGQSLGGGLAATAALVTDTPAVTFNASGVHDRTLERNGLDADAAKAYAAEGLIRSYAVDNEILTHLQEDSFPLRYAMPDAPGHRIELPDPDPLSFFERLVPGKMLMHRIDLHYIEAVMEAQDKAGLDVRGQASHAPVPDERREAANQLLRDAIGQLAPQRRELGLDNPEHLLNATAAVAAQAGRDGLRRIDHVVPSRDGGQLFAVQGHLHDPAHRRSLSDLDNDLQTPVRESAVQLQEQAAQRQAQQQAEPQQQLRPAPG